MPDPDEWWMDLSPPTRGDFEDTYREFYFFEWVKKTSIRFGVVFEHMALELRRVFEPIQGVMRPRHRIPEKKPYAHDPPTNRIYPTSADSWFNEYSQPVRRSQITQHKRPYRR